MRCFVCTDHDGQWPVPVASVVFAPDLGEAILLLDAELKRVGLKVYVQAPYTLREITMDQPVAHVLSDGNY